MKRIRKKVTIELTLAEAKALWSAAETTVSHPDATEWMHPAHRAAMYRGFEKLGSAWMAVQLKLQGDDT